MLNQFKSPPCEYRLMPFWIWNAIPDPVEVERRIREMAERGIGGFIVCPSTDPAEDSSSAWSHCVRLAGKLAKDLGMVAEFDDPAACSFAAAEDTWADRLVRAKLASSTVHAAGGMRMAARMFGDEGWDLTPGKMKAAVDLECVLGANLFCPEAMYYTLAGMPGSGSAPPQSHQSTLWPNYGLFAEYAARLSYALSQGKHRAQVALLLPGRTFAEEKSVRGSRLVRDFAQDCFATYCEWLLRLHIDYDLLAEKSLMEAAAIDQSLLIGDESYELLILPPMTAVEYGAAMKIKEFVEDGGKVLGTMLLPVEDSLNKEHEKVRRVFAGIFDVNPLELRANLLDGIAPRNPQIKEAKSGALFLEAKRPADLVRELRAAVAKAVRLDVSVRRESAECPDILVCARKHADLDLFFLCNQAPEAREVQVSIRCDRAPLLLDPETGQASALPNCTQQGSRTIFMQRFEPFGSLLIGFHDEPALAVPAQVMETGVEIPLSNDWDFEILGPNSLPLPEWESDSAGNCCRAVFDAEYIPPDLALLYEHNSETGDDRGLPIVTVNGKESGPAGRLEDANFRTFHIADLAIVGKNVITLAGLPHDPNESVARARLRLIGSFSLGSDKQTLAEPVSAIKTGSWTTQGYPFYSGTAAYRQTVEIPPFLGSGRVVMQVDQPGEWVEFVINGVHAGTRLWAPFMIDITPLVKPGPNAIELRVTNTIVNDILGQDRPSGLLDGARLIIF